MTDAAAPADGAAAAGAGELIVDVQGASRRFRVGSEDIWAVRDVSLQIRQGEFVGLIGRSGSGKTTLLNLVAGLDLPSEGTVRISGEDITKYSERQLTQMRRRRVGFVFQSFGLLPLLSAYENVELSLRIAGAGVRERRRRASELLEAVGLAGRARHRPYELSGGEQQRVAIARALANEPDLILADEPTGELDSSTAVSIFRLLHDLVEDRGVTILTTTHDRTVMELVPRVEEMRDGRLLEPEEQELFRYTVREERSRFAAELPPDVQEEVSAASVEAVDFAPTAEERVAATVAAHPETTEAAARSAVGGGTAAADEPPEVSEEAERSFAPPPEQERPDWSGRREPELEAAPDEPAEPPADASEPAAAEQSDEAGESGDAPFAPPAGAERPAWGRPAATEDEASEPGEPTEASEQGEEIVAESPVIDAEDEPAAPPEDEEAEAAASVDEGDAAADESEETDAEWAPPSVAAAAAEETATQVEPETRDESVAESAQSAESGPAEADVDEAEAEEFAPAGVVADAAPAEEPEADREEPDAAVDEVEEADAESAGEPAEAAESAAALASSSRSPWARPQKTEL